MKNDIENLFEKEEQQAPKIKVERKDGEPTCSF